MRRPFAAGSTGAGLDSGFHLAGCTDCVG